MAIFDSPITARGKIAWSKIPLLGPASTPEAAKVDIQKWIKLRGTTTSMESLMASYGPGDDIAVFDITPSNLRSVQEVRDHFGPLMNKNSDINLEIPIVVIDSDGIFGIQLSTQQITIKLSDGSTQILAFRQSDCLRKSGEKWYSFFEHRSVAVNPKTGKGVTAF